MNQLVVSNYIPESTSSYPIIGVYTMFNIGLTSISVGASVFVLKLHFRGQNIKSVPKLIKKIFCIDLKMESDIKKLTRFKNMLIKTKSNNKNIQSNKETFNKLLETTKKYLKSCESKNKKKSTSEIVYDEWRLLAQKIDLILFFLTFIVIFMTPLIMFGKFYLRDTMSNVSKKCSCDNFNN